MKKNVVSKILAVAVAVAMLGTLAACGGSSAPAASDSKAEEAAPAAEEAAPAEEAAEEVAEEGEVAAPAAADGGMIFQDFADTVDLDVVAFVGSNEPDGLRTDPVSKFLEEKLNINLYLSHVTEADWPTQLSAMMADNDLPDIFYLSDYAKQLPMLLQAGNVLAIDEYFDYMPNTANDPAANLMKTANMSSAVSPDGHLYLWGLCKGSWDDGTIPTCGHYIRWDLYKEAGYPTLESYNDDLPNVLGELVALEPETENGEKTYGAGAWFGNGQDWGEWVFTYGLAPQEGANLVNTSGRVIAVSTVDSTPIEVNQLTDHESYIWRAARFYNKLNQMGLLDPDAFTMKSDVYEETLANGKYMFNVPGWMSTTANNRFNKTEGNTKALISLPSISSDAEDRFGSMYRGERQYVVNGQTEQPERCVALLDLVSTYAFSTIQFSGFEGDLYTIEDGILTPTDEMLTTDWNEENVTKHGRTVYHHFMGFGNGTIDPATGQYVDIYQFSEKAKAAKLNDTFKDFCEHFGQATQADVYRAETPNCNSMNFISFAEPDADMKGYVNEINAYMGKNIFNAVAAKSDDEFEATFASMVDDLVNTYHVNEVYDYYLGEAKSQGDNVAMLAALKAEVDAQYK